MNETQLLTPEEETRLLKSNPQAKSVHKIGWTTVFTDSNGYIQIDCHSGSENLHSWYKPAKKPFKYHDMNSILIMFDERGRINISNHWGHNSGWYRPRKSGEPYVFHEGRIITYHSNGKVGFCSELYEWVDPFTPSKNAYCLGVGYFSDENTLYDEKGRVNLSFDGGKTWSDWFFPKNNRCPSSRQESSNYTYRMSGRPVCWHTLLNSKGRMKICYPTGKWTSWFTPHPKKKPVLHGDLLIYWQKNGLVEILFYSGATSGIFSSKKRQPFSLLGDENYLVTDHKGRRLRHLPKTGCTPWVRRSYA